MAIGDKYFGPTKAATSLIQAMRLMFKEDENGGPILDMSAHPNITGLSVWSASAFPAEIFYNYDAGVHNTLDESPEFEVYAASDPGSHTGESFTVHVPSNLQIHFDGVWNDPDTSFTAILGDGTGSNSAARMKFRLADGLSVGTTSDNITVSHSEFATDPYTIITVAGRVAQATNSTLIAWQNALSSTKPSGKLIYHLNTLIAGMDSDGDLVEHDYLHLVAGMETDEQRLLPIKSSAGYVPAELFGSGANPAVFNRTGIQLSATTQKTLRLKWKPITNGVKCTQNSNSLYCTFSASPTTSNRFYCGGPSTSWFLSKGSPLQSRAWSASGLQSGNTFNAARLFATNRDNSATFRGWTNQDGFQPVGGQAATSAAVGDFYLRMPGANNSSDTGDSVSPVFALMHMIGVGSHLITYADVRTRLNTYYTALGLATVN